MMITLIKIVMIYSLDIYLGKFFPYCIRSYKKFQDLAATVCNFVKLVKLIFSFINYYFNNFERDKFLIDYFFNISDKEKELKDYKSNNIFEKGKITNKKISLELNKNKYSDYKIKINSSEKNEKKHKNSMLDFCNIKTKKYNENEFSNYDVLF